MHTCYQLTPDQKKPIPVSLPLLFLFLSFLQFLQVFLGELDDVRSLLLGGQRRGGEGARSSVERLAVGGARQILPQMLVHGLALQEFGSEGGGQDTRDIKTHESGGNSLFLWTRVPKHLKIFCLLNIFIPPFTFSCLPGKYRVSAAFNTLNLRLFEYRTILMAKICYYRVKQSTILTPDLLERAFMPIR